MIVDFPAPNTAHQGLAQQDSDNLALSALQLAALGSETRLALFRLLVKWGQTGLNTGQISDAMAMAGSTLNHHLATLETAGLVERLREGRNIRCRVVAPAMHGLVDYLTQNCCCEVHSHD